MIGLATIYFLPGNVLYCGPIYSESLDPWVAVDVTHYMSGAARCGDIITVVTPQGSLSAKAMDAGYLREHGIVVDFPKHLAPFVGRTTARVYFPNKVRLYEH